MSGYPIPVCIDDIKPFRLSWEELIGLIAHLDDLSTPDEMTVGDPFKALDAYAHHADQAQHDRRHQIWAEFARGGANGNPAR